MKDNIIMIVAFTLSFGLALATILGCLFHFF
jgi:hypothetical protein